MCASELTRMKICKESTAEYLIALREEQIPEYRAKLNWLQLVVGGCDQCCCFWGWFWSNFVIEGVYEIEFISEFDSC